MSFYLACVATDKGQNQLGLAKGQLLVKAGEAAWLN